MWDAVKIMLREKHVASNACNVKAKSKINDLSIHLMKLEKEEQFKPKTSTRKKITEIRTEINGIRTREAVEKISETKSWFFRKIDMIDNLQQS